MDDLIATFLAVTSTADEATAKQYLEMTGGDLEYAVTLYMESVPPPSAHTGAATHEDDEAIAQKLQNEAYSQGQPEVREADASVHRHETLMDTFDNGFGGNAGGYSAYNHLQQRMSRQSDIFGSGRVGIFNQRLDEDENEFYHHRRFEEVDEDDEDEEGDDEYIQIHDADDDNNDEESDVMLIGSDEEEQPSSRSVGRRRANRNARNSELSFTQQRLANLFRPPFDIMAKIDFDSAKIQGRSTKKWILINIQDAREFQCQVMNRDFWSSDRVKAKVRENFIFLQYQHDSPNGLNYTNFYSTDSYPHLAIIDPLTGERVHRWKDGEVPSVNEWIEEADDFLEQFSLLPNSNNPVVKHEVKFDPDTLSEEQQIEFAMKQSMLENQEAKKGSVDDPIVLDPEEEPSSPKVQEESKVPPPTADVFSSIISEDHEEPQGPPSSTTRVQIRFPNGKRVIHKFDIEKDTVRILYQWLKFTLQNSAEGDYGLSPEDRFSISSVSNKSEKSLLELIDTSIGEAGLKNASILLEKD